MIRPLLLLLSIATLLPAADEPLTKADAEETIEGVWNERASDAQQQRQAELKWTPSKDPTIKQGNVHAAGKEMRYLVKRFGKAPEGQRSLWISMHGGGGTAPQVNDQQWKNQIRLYQPKEGYYVAPRAPTNAWNLWHQGHIDALFQRLIENFVIEHGVDPDRVYLMGYSAGGDGVYQLAPRMADCFASASMMAGHPNDASPLGLRNLPFMIFVGGKDAGYKRNEVAAKWGERLKELRKKDPEGYVHKVTIYPGLGHWMNGQDSEALPWMAGHDRNPWPRKLVWHQSSRTHERFYWLAVPTGQAQKGQTLRASVHDQHIEVQRKGVTNFQLRLNDALLNLDLPIKVTVDGKVAFEGKVPRTKEAIRASLKERLDRKTVATAMLTIDG